MYQKLCWVPFAKFFVAFFYLANKLRMTYKTVSSEFVDRKGFR